MTKSDLKTGMLVQIREGTKYLVMLGEFIMNNGNKETMFLVRDKGFLQGSSINKNLTHRKFVDLDIIKVYSISSTGGFLNFNEASRILLWERSNIKETIKIGEAVYDKAEFEEAVKNLKQLNK